MSVRKMDKLGTKKTTVAAEERLAACNVRSAR